MVRNDLTNKKFGRLKVLYLDKQVRTKDKNGKTLTKTYWKCKCECGNECSILVQQLTSGKTKSCGCFQKEHRDSIKDLNKTHGDTNTRFYHIWTKMLDRCYNKKSVAYKYYGAKNIIVEWNSYDEFKKDMYESYLEHVNLYGEKDTTIDRIDSGKNYSKNNCRWATCKEQVKNRSNSIKVIINENESLSIKEVSELTGIKIKALESRYRNSKYNKTYKIPYDELVTKYKK